MEKSYRIHTNISRDTLLNVNMKQDFDFLEILSLKLRQKDSYRLHSSNYGVIIGRVLANDAFGIPNAKISVFIERDSSDPVDMENIYPYSEVTSKDREGRRYNLLPDYSDDDCYRVVGTFPNKRYLLDDNIQLEVYEKYWKYTTVTNNAGDYMIFGVPAGSQQVHVDIDLSDIGVLSQKPRDFTYRGYDLSEFDSPSQFKSSTNLDSLRQIFSQNKSVYVYPFWGDAENGIAAITRCDIEIAYKFEPTCVFMGSIISDNEGNSIGHKCAPSEDNGMNDQLIAGEGTIEMIRKTTDGLVEEFPIQGNALIDSDGVWCYQIPMNLDYVGTDEYGNIVPTDNPSKGIPTRTQVRFRISKTETGDEGFSRHTAKYLVPMNPVTYEENEVLMTQAESGIEIEKMYNFGSSTPQSCFRDLYWNNVYSVKNFIPKIQVAHRPYAPNYSALKGANLVENQNPVPFNKLRIDIPFMYMIVCILFVIVMVIIHFINTLIWIIQMIRGLCIGFKIFGTRIEICPFKVIIPKFGCIAMPAGLAEGNVAYYPGCHCPDSDACRNSSCPEEMEGSCIKSSDNSELKDKIQQNLARDYKIIKLDFYQDWLNGSLYMPLWYWRKRKKKKFLFFTISGAKNEFCDCDKTYSRLKTYVACSMSYKNNSLGTDSSTIDLGEDRWHKKRASRLWFSNGVIKGVENKDGLIAYYYTAYQANNDDNIDIHILQRTKRFLYVRLYATDIILLGNLNENNIYGIPQLYTALPSTTANIPPIAAIEESLTDETNDPTPRNDTAGDAEDSGTTITTGMDWGHDGGDQVPRYRKGLFIDLTCTYAATRSKSCINVERLSELGVNPDMTFKMSFSNGGNDIKTGAIDADGFINKYELDDMDNRAAFATLNHIGFIPQDYQDSISGYTTQVQDENTGYLVPKFKYIYPVDFDGRLELIMKNYKRGFEQATYDEADPSYVTFRLGAEASDDYRDNSEGRIRHFYFKNGSRYEMPVYNNSFYFFFGINKGSTAIDKFNKMFYAPCFQNVKKPFTLDYSFVGRSYCPPVYENYENYSGYGYIRVTLDDIQIPYSYKLYDSTGALVISEGDMEVRDFVIGGTIDDEGKVISNEGGIIRYQTGEQEPIEGVGLTHINYLTNQQYTLYVTDENGKTLSERIKLEMPKISVQYESESLGTKFYNTGTTRIDYICTDETDFYGRLRILSYTVDGYMYTITACTIVGYIDNQYVLRIDGMNHDDEDANPLYTSAFIKLGILDVSDGRITKDCLCDTTNRPTALQRANGTYSINGTAMPHWIRIEDAVDEEGNKTGGEWPTFLVYQPNRFTVTIAQICDGEELDDNTTSDIVNVNNGENFNTFVGSAGDVSVDMPVKFMLGSVNDNNDAIIGAKSQFYRLTAVTTPYGEGLRGWYGSHQEDTYQFHRTENQVLLKNVDTWTDFVTLNEDINTHASKATILAYKFNAMFSLASASYVITDTATVYHSAMGGVHPTLYRSVVPIYTDNEKFKQQYVLNDSNMSTVISEYPMVVGRNYFKMDGEGYGPHWNNYYTNREYLGNYFAAFTRNGGYISKVKVDPKIKVMKIPNYTKVTPMNGSVVKQIGKDVKGQIDQFRQVHTKDTPYNPYLRTLFVDRRFDYRFVLFAPSMTNSIQLYPESEGGKEKIWKSARISGETFNGVELSYDEEYNIISADTNATDAAPGIEAQEATIATPNKRLEYSYNFSDNDVDSITIYNNEPKDNVVWEGEGTKDNQIVKRFYEANYSGYDIRNFFWSSFNKQRLYDLVTGARPYRPFGGINESKNIILTGDLRKDVPYVFRYPYNDDFDGMVHTGIDTLYNGDFNREQANRNYPTHRFIDICNIPPAEVHNFEISPCSYEMNAYKDTDGTVKCEANPTDGISFYDVYKPPINFIEPNAGNNDYGNVRYKIKQEGRSKFVRFQSSGVSLCFKCTEKSADGFKVYTAVPRVIKVLDYQNSPRYGNLDGISYIKTVAKNLDDEICARHDNIIDTIDDPRVLIYKFGEGIGFYWMKFVTDIVLPSGVKVEFSREDNRLTRHDGTKDHDNFFYRPKTGDFDERNIPYIASDENDFLNITFVKDIPFVYENGFPRDDIKIFTIFLHREYIWQEDDKLKRQLSVLEHGDLYDVRHLLIRVNLNDDKDSSGKIIPMTYVEKMKLTPGDINAYAYDLTGETNTNIPTSGGTTPTGGTLDNGGGPVSGDTELYAYIQVITFDFQFHPKYPPIDRECEAFADYDMMRYVFRFKNRKGDTFDIDKVEVTTTPSAITSSTTEVTLHFKLRWTQDMGILADLEWQDNTRVTIFAKNQENFTYKIMEFGLDFICQYGNYDPETKKDTGMQVSDGENINPNPTCIKIAIYQDGNCSCT